MAGRQQIQNDDGVEPVVPAETGDFVGAGRPRFNTGQLTRDRPEPVRSDDVIAERGLVKIFAARIPAGNHEFVKTGELMGTPVRFGNQRGRLSKLPAHQRDTRHERGGHGTIQPGDKQSEPAHGLGGSLTTESQKSSMLWMTLTNC